MQKRLLLRRADHDKKDEKNRSDQIPPGHDADESHHHDSYGSHQPAGHLHDDEQYQVFQPFQEGLHPGKCALSYSPARDERCGDVWHSQKEEDRLYHRDCSDVRVPCHRRLWHVCSDESQFQCQPHHQHDYNGICINFPGGLQ